MKIKGRGKKEIVGCTLDIKSHDVSELYENRLLCEIYICTVKVYMLFINKICLNQEWFTNSSTVRNCILCTGASLRSGGVKLAVSAELI
jgi:hypothetical protein